MTLATICSIVIGVLLGASPDGARQAAPASPAITIGSADQDYEMRNVALAADGTLYVALVASPKGLPPGRDAALRLARVDAQNKVTVEAPPVSAPAQTRSRTRIEVPGLIASGGRVALLTPAEGDTLSLLVAGVKQPIPEVRLDRDKTLSTVTRARPAAPGGGSLLVVGALGVRPALAEITAEGKVVRQQVIAEEGVVLVDAIAEPRGEFIVAGQRGDGKDSSVWLARIAADGKVTQRQSFPGRFPRLARGGDGAYAVVFEQLAAGGSDVVLRGFATDLAERWRRTLVTGEKVVSPFSVVATADGGYLVAGTKNRALWVSRLKSSGEPVWTDARPSSETADFETVLNVELVAGAKDAALAYTAFIVSGKEQRQVVRVRRLPLS